MAVGGSSIPTGGGPISTRRGGSGLFCLRRGSKSDSKSVSLPECAHVYYIQQIPVIPARVGFGYGFLSPTRITIEASAALDRCACASSKIASVAAKCNSSSKRTSFAPMEACSVARIMSLRDLSIHQPNLCSLVLRVLPKLLALKKFRKDPSLMETVVPELPQDILMDIFSLLEIPDLMRAGSVCSSWRSAYTSLGSQLGQYKRPQTPCLLYTSESAGDNVACLYSLTEKRVYKLTLPDPPIRNRHLIGSSHGWLVTADDRSELHLVNPITGEQIALPSVITIEEVKPIFDDAGATIHKYELWMPEYNEDSEMVGHTPSIYALDELREELYFKAFVFPDSSTGSYIVVLLHGPEDQLSFARAGDCKWTPLPAGWNYHECIYMDGLLYAFTQTGGIDAFDLSGPTVTRKIITDAMKNRISGRMYTVQAPLGDVLQVYREQLLMDVDDEELGVETKEFSLYKVDMAAKELVEINGLHDHVLFLGQSQSQCLRAEEFPQLKANHIYFTDDEAYIWKYKNNRRDIGVFNLENDSREEIMSHLWCSWPNPIWITPNLTKMNLGFYK